MFQNFFPIEYSEPLFRPPSEAESLILQITHGCTWNQCSFCEMYTSKKFSIKPEDKILKEIQAISVFQPNIRKVFLADGNPMALSTEKLLNVLKMIRQYFPKVRRISTYANSRDLLVKQENELKELSAAGLKLIYTGIESGDDKVLKMVNKGETESSITESLLKAKAAGMKLSVMILNGIGGKNHSQQHAVNSAVILNKIQPEYASVLVLSFPFGIEHYTKKFAGNFIPMSIIELLRELESFISHTQLKETIFRSNHASNYLALSGILSRDKNLFLEKISQAIKNPETASLHEEWQRGL